MGNHKLRLSNIIPNVWFYKLKEMTTNSSSNSNNNKFIRNHHLATKATNLDPSTPPPSLPRKSYHFTRRNLNSKSSRKTRPTTKSSSSSSVSTACSCATATAHSVQSKPASTTSSSSLDNLSLPPDQLHCFDRMVACSSTSCNGSSNSPVPDDLANDNDHNDVVIGVATMSLTPIRTEHKKFSDLVREIGAAEEEQTDIDDQPNKQRKSPAVRRISTSSGSPRRVRIRINSPKLSKRVESNAAGRKSVKSSESVAVVKSSADPERDFRESMVEMIVENEIRAAKDLEDLLACYLSLNSVEYHHLIIQVFKQIWFGLNQIHYS